MGDVDGEASLRDPDAALADVLAGAAPRRAAEAVPLADAAGRVLAEDARARGDVPRDDNSAMDGWVAHSADLPGTLPMAGVSRAGVPLGGSLGAGRAARITTGGVLPASAEAADLTIVPVERVIGDGPVTTPDGVTVIRLPAAAPGAHVRRAGTDLRDGDLVLGAGTRLGAFETGVLAGAGVGRPAVWPRPRVTIVSTGDELVGADTEALAPGQVRDSNSPLLAALLAAAGADVRILARAPDRPADLRALLAAGLDGGATDVLVTTGGVSVGGHDLVKDALAELDVERVFWRVALKPGKPLWFGRHGSGARVVGLPGNPVAVAVCGWLFVVPLIAALSGDPHPRPRSSTARLTGPLDAPDGRTEAVRVRLATDADAVLWATPTDRRQDSYVLSSLRGTDALAMLPPGARLAAGDRCEVRHVRRA